MRIGLIADTHGLLRPEAVAALRGCNHILHAGDIGGADVLAGLEAVAPVTSIRGNNDTAAWASALPDTRLVHLGGIDIYMLHELKSLAEPLPAECIHVIVAGHSHKPLIEMRGHVLVVNPGSAGRRRFTLPVTVGELRVDAGRVAARILPLPISP
ncbi:metallophosphoesterase family protein [Cognatilysobacter lacus]|uniref:Phosphoesterase n=1 Tax=Cognatilysobacter lacus TaxID=1643323 RepID=A0A5D8Z701_9GAMM|nr:metallophosphoesterase family protein [Lysobacter lacus]TZF89902.1 metallophosphoesterase family protein [Lysobacter lacus]